MCEPVTVNPDIFTIEFCLSQILGHTFEFTESETWHLLHLLTSKMAGLWTVDGVILSWTRVGHDILVFFTA